MHALVYHRAVDVERRPVVFTVLAVALLARARHRPDVSFLQVLVQTQSAVGPLLDGVPRAYPTCNLIQRVAQRPPDLVQVQHLIALAADLDFLQHRLAYPAFGVHVEVLGQVQQVHLALLHGHFLAVHLLHLRVVVEDVLVLLRGDLGLLLALLQNADVNLLLLLIILFDAGVRAPGWGVLLLVCNLRAGPGLDLSVGVLALYLRAAVAAPAIPELLHLLLVLEPLKLGRLVLLSHALGRSAVGLVQGVVYFDQLGVVALQLPDLVGQHVVVLLFAVL